MDSSEAESRILVALLLRSRSSGFGQYHSELGLADDVGLEDRRFVQLVWRGLQDQELIESTFNWNEDLGDTVSSFRLTSRGMKVAEADLRKFPEHAVSVPASDRLVLITDNQREDLEEQLAHFREGVRGDNAMDAEEKEFVLWEIANFELTITQPRVAFDLIQRFVNKITRWVGDSLLKAAAAEAAKKVLITLSRIAGL